MDAKNKKVVKIIAVIVYVIALVLVGKGLVERVVVKAKAEEVLYSVKSGLDDETVNELVDDLISQCVGDGIIGATLQKAINGDDVNDIYHCLLNGMDYRVDGIEKDREGNYRIGMVIANNNNIMILKRVGELFAERYKGGFLHKIDQAFADISSDKTQLVAGLYYEAAQMLEKEYGPDLKIAQYYALNLGVDGEPEFVNENGNGFYSFVLMCAGVSVDPGDAPRVRDEVKIYAICMFVLLAIPVFIKVIGARKQGADHFRDSQEVSNNDCPEPGTQSSALQYREPSDSARAVGNGTPVLYARSPQHNNMPFAVHDSPLFIGRDQTRCRVVFANETKGVSGVHCSLEFDSDTGSFILTDLGSTYGTFLSDGRKLSANVPCKIQAGEEFYVGDRSNTFSVELNG
ncbi:MAG: FHA domain-containing protein [Lachnospiraceae bacterium]|nr:FHA domain-containing protein [Lachnospiraceae bacterium]